MGWPAEWPGDPGKKHFIMENARWLIFDRKGKTVALPFETEKVVIRAKNVKMLEFVSHRTALGGKHDEW